MAQKDTQFQILLTFLDFPVKPAFVHISLNTEIYLPGTCYDYVYRYDTAIRQPGGENGLDLYRSTRKHRATAIAGQ